MIRHDERYGPVWIQCQKVQFYWKSKLHPVMTNSRIRTTTAGPIDVHPTDLALVVHYTLTAKIYSETGEKIADEAKQMQKT